MKILFLGTSAAVPTLKRNVPSVALCFGESGKYWLFDCGEGTQQQLKKASLKLSKLERVFISHLHGDHVFGLPGMLSSRGLEGITEGLDIHGPKGIKSYIESTRKIVNFHLTYELGIHDISAGQLHTVFEDEKFIVRATTLKHGLITYGFSVTRKPRYRFMVEKARENNIPEGPMFKDLKNRKTIKLEDGRKFDGNDFVEKIDDGKKVVYCGDTAYCRNTVELAKGADLLIHEATFSEKERELADRSFHSTVGDACRVAKEAGAAKLVLTHISPRYDSNIEDGTVYGIDDLEKEAKALFTETILAKDLMELEVT